MKLSRMLLTGIVAALTAQANADLLYTFDAGSTAADGAGFNGGTYAWSASHQAVQATTTSGGWTLGGSSPRFEFAWPVQATMQTYANNAANYRVAFDLSVDATSWPVAASDWFNLLVAGNSDGAVGWSQLTLASGLWHDVNDMRTLSWHGDFSFADLGWQPGDTWFQVFFGPQSGSIPVDFYVDNLAVYAVPEPGVLALAGLGAAALLLRRRK